MASLFPTFKDLTDVLGNLAEFLQTKRSIIDSHHVDFLTHDNWDTLDEDLKQNLFDLSEEELAKLPSGDYENLKEPLKGFVSEASQRHISKYPWLKNAEDITSKDDTTGQFIGFFMNRKKCFEVEAMTRVIYCLVKQHSLQTVLDIGSGKGYLSQHLSLYYGLQVIGIDSSNFNTNLAIKRNKTVEKMWPSLVKNVENGIKKKDNLDTRTDVLLEDKKTATSHSCKCKCKETLNAYKGCGVCSIRKTDVQQGICSSKEKYLVSQTVAQELSPDLGSTDQKFKEDSSDKKSPNNLKNLSSRICPCSLCTREPHCFQGQESVTDRTECVHSANNETDKEREYDKGKSFVPITGTVNCNFLIKEKLKEVAESQQILCKSEDGIAVVGLHACGGLTCAGLKMFVHDPSIVLCCIIGCCYHHVVEEFEEPLTNLGASENEFTFPMSHYLKDKHFSLGRNARTLASQAVERISSEKKVPSQSLFYRAVLQVILRDKLVRADREYIVGKLKKVKSFHDYVRRALQKLGLSHEIQLSNEELTQYYDQYKHQIRNIQAFYQLRASLAPCIEALLLLDRLCYLHEQENVKEAYIAQVFDPVQSPRCYAIIAQK